MPVFIFAAILFHICGSFSYAEVYPSRVCMQNVCVQVEVAKNFEERSAGLMSRKSLPDESGMLFIFDQAGFYNFWMKNMLIPLDIIWIADDRTVIDIAKYAYPCTKECLSFSPKAPAKYVLEVNSGFCDKNKIQTGQKVAFKD